MNSDKPNTDGAARIQKVPIIPDQRGNLSFLQQGDQVPFEIRRVYWIYDVPGGQQRGSHAFRQTQEVIIALSGSLDVVLHDGERESVYSLNRSYNALYVPRMLWRTLGNFSTNSLALILASTDYDETDYIREFERFQRALAEAR